MEPHQCLKSFLPELRIGLRREGLDKSDIAAIERDITTRAKPKPLKSQKAYEVAWTACQVTMDILTTPEDGSEAADWYNDLCHRVFDYEDDYEARLGHRPLNPGGPKWTDGPSGNA